MAAPYGLRKAESPADLADERHDRGVGIYLDRLRWRFQCGELRVEQGWSGEVALTAGEPLLEQRAACLEKHPADTRNVTRQLGAVSCSQRRAGDDHVHSVTRGFGHQTVDPRQPGTAIGVVERYATGHLGDVRWRVQIVRVDELPLQPLRQCPTHRGLACSGRAHHDDDHGSTLERMSANATTARYRSGTRRTRTDIVELPAVDGFSSTTE